MRTHARMLSMFLFLALCTLSYLLTYSLTHSLLTHCRYDASVKDTKSMYDALTARADNAALMGSGSGGAGYGNGKGNNALLNSASAVQDQTESGLDRIDASIAASKDIGNRTLFELEDQRRQMGSINDDLTEFDGRVQQAASLLYR